MIKFKRLRVANFKVLKHADVSLLDRGLVLIVGDNQDTAAADSNGAGKTTLFEAIAWALYGEIPAHGKLTDKVIRSGATEASVELAFTNGDRSYRVTRTRTKRGGSLTWHVNDVVATGRTQADTQAMIVEALGLDWDAFRNTVMYGQGDLGRFADRDTTDSDRKAILKRILGLERFDEALAKVKAARAALQSDRAKINQEFTSGQALLGRARDEVLRVEKTSALWEETKAEKLATASRALSEVASAGVEELLASINRLTGIEEELVSELEAYEPFSGELARAQAEVSRLRADSLRNVKATAALEMNRQRAVANHKRYEQSTSRGTCPECGQELHVDMSEKITATLEVVSNLTEEIAELDAEREEIEKKTDLACAEVKRCLELIAYRDDVVTDLRQLRDALRVARREQQQATTLEARRREAQQQVDILAAQTNPYLERLEELAQEIERREANLNETRTQLAKLDAEDVPLVFWEQGFGNKGLPAFAMDSVLPLINMAAARYLRVLSDGDLQVELTSTTDKKDGTQKESLDLRVVVEGTEGAIPSGGQWRKISLAVDLALMDLVASREGSRIDALFLDEALDGLDEEGRARVVQLLRSLRETRSTILVVTHDAPVQEHVPDVIVVTKKGGESTVES